MLSYYYFSLEKKKRNYSTLSSICKKKQQTNPKIKKILTSEKRNQDFELIFLEQVLKILFSFLWKYIDIYQSVKELKLYVNEMLQLKLKCG